MLGQAPALFRSIISSWGMPRLHCLIQEYLLLKLPCPKPFTISCAAMGRGMSYAALLELRKARTRHLPRLALRRPRLAASSAGFKPVPWQRQTYLYEFGFIRKCRGKQIYLFRGLRCYRFAFPNLPCMTQTRLVFKRGCD
jgi:hypothetical protein